MKFDFNIDNNSIQQLPPDKRQPKLIAFIQSLMSGIKGTQLLYFENWYNSDLKERIYFGSPKLNLEYALNKFLNTTFVQPTGTSQVYITKLSRESYGLIVGLDEAHSSAIAADSGQPIGYDYTFWYPINFQINITVAVSNTDEEIRNFVNKYIPQSITFQIEHI